MKVVNDPSVPSTCSKRQVLFYPADWKDPLPETMEEIKISIVNDRATGFKRERDEVLPVTPCAKRSCHAAFSCSTPLSASDRSWLAQQLDFPAWHPPKQTPEQDELDDSLLELSENEDDSPLYITLEQEETLLHIDDDDCCYAAEPLQNDKEMSTYVVTFTSLEPEKEGENGGASPCKTLDIPDGLTEEPDCDGDISNYAAMPPSPCQSAKGPVEVTEPNQSSVCNVKSLHEFLTARTVNDSDLPTPLSDFKEACAFQLPNSFSPKLPLQTSISLCGVDAVNWTEDPDLAFDCDIDNLLAIGPEAASLSEEDNAVEVAAITTKGKSSIMPGSTLPPQNLESDQVLTAHAACSISSDAVQNLSSLSPNTPGLPKVHHHNHLAEPGPPKESLPSSIVTAEPKLITKSSGTKQNVECQKPLEAEETKGMKNDESTSRPTDPTPSAAPTANGNESKIMHFSSCKAQGFSGPEKEKPLVAVAALPRPSFRRFLSEVELERNKQTYCRNVSMHIGSQGGCNLEDPNYELASLLHQISRENQNWQHLSDLTKRNHPRFGKKPSKRCTLDQWMSRNGKKKRFKNIPDIFQRSPIPDALPSSS